MQSSDFKSTKFAPLYRPKILENQAHYVARTFPISNKLLNNYQISTEQVGERASEI
jgi:hypothetical protein